MRLYFAHPMSEYGTKREAKALKAIKKRWPYAKLFNPNHKKHQEGYETMGWLYFETLASSMDVVVAMAYPDGEWGMGVFAEMKSANNRNSELLQVHDDGTFSEVNLIYIRPLSILETSRRNRK